MIGTFKIVLAAALWFALGGCSLDESGTLKTQVDHFYTIDSGEAVAAAGSGYQPEGIAGYVYTQPVSGSNRFYRLYKPGDTDHFYTTSGSEKEAALANGYQDEGTVGSIFPSMAAARITLRNAGEVIVPLYRLYHPENVDHFYTTSAAERDSAIANSGYQDEGIAGYLFPDSRAVSQAFPAVDDKTTPLFRLYLP